MVVNKVPPKDSMDYKVDSIAVDVRSIQEITEGIRSLTHTMQGGGKVNRSQKVSDRQAAIHTPSNQLSTNYCSRKQI